MSVLRDLGLGLVLTVMLWSLLEASQSYWFEQVNLGGRGRITVAAAVLLAAGVLIAAVALVPVSPWVTATPVVLLLLIVGPLLVGVGGWWPDAFPGSDQRLAASAGTYLALGVLATATIVRARAAVRRQDASR